ncbi:MAG: PRC-barrel domain-containing protein [Candidatus Kerfeldbacteria bacterium]
MIPLKELRHAPVETKNGLRLGRLVDVEIDEESHTVMTYIVQAGRLTRPLVQKQLRIDRRQVLSVSRERIIVDDAAQTETERIRLGLSKNAAATVSAQPC